MIGKKKNRLNRLQKRLTDKELTGERRMKMTQRVSELTKELSPKK